VGPKNGRQLECNIDILAKLVDIGGPERQLWTDAKSHAQGTLKL